MNYSMASTGIRQDIEELPFSPIREIVRSAEGKKDIIPFWFGEPDVSTPDFIRESAKLSLDRGETFYAPNSGQMLLRETICEYMNGIYGTEITTENITVSVSGMNALMIAAQALARKGSKVVVLLPSWPNIPAIQRIMGAKLEGVPISMKDGKWNLDLDQVIDTCDSNTSAIVINSPNNPSGWTMSNEEQKALLDYSRKQGIWIVSDEVYARIYFKSDHAPSFCEIMDQEDRVVVVNSFSKSWAMTGWRLGWITAPSNLEVQFEKLTEYNVAGPAPFIQQAGITALCKGEDFIRESNGRYQKALSYFQEWAESQERIEFVPPHAAFYAFFHIWDGKDSLEMAKDLLKTSGVGLAPGCAFGPQYDSYLRLCFATSIPKLEKGLERLEKWIKGLK
ncbi:MAG: putative N-acetyl-LL-diaminopimelate aminotransferase [Deltaproteobacteria bacterium]|jgi:aspartate/methionine/tyrosine aminotransferase|nr:putative N-acetyl-LL-diaminopimelate aminotransferase [Deltaproteobacteria bacterium]